MQPLLISSLLMFALVAAFLVHKILKDNKVIVAQQHTLMENKLRQLQLVQRLRTTNSVLRRADEERRHIAKDLYDGLAGLLSGVKISLSQIESHTVFTTDTVLVFQRSLDMLDNSISELRRIAHNIMPEALAKFGLVAALRDFCEVINTMKAVVISFQTVGTERRFGPVEEIMVYRIVQELLNNIIRHSAAGRTLVQIVYEPKKVSITVEDNGSGFDKQILKKNNLGSGWPNIQLQVEYLRGLIDVITKPGEGTSIQINLPL